MQTYIQSHFIGAEYLQPIERCFKEFKAYLSQFPDVLKLTVCVCGSYTTGLASIANSSLDLIVSMDGGSLTSSLDRDQLVLALSTGLKDWECLTDLKTTEGNHKLLLAEMEGLEIKFSIRTCKPRTFPMNELYHTQLFGSYSLCDPRVPVVISLIKSWARKAGYSFEIPSANCPFSGFHWTLLVVFFLIKIRMVPNLHRLSTVVSQLPKEVFGPRFDRDCFVVVSDRSVGEKLTHGSPSQQLSIGKVILDFFGWLSEFDLLSKCVALQVAGTTLSDFPIRLGWINVVDPCKAGWASVIDPSIDQKSQVIFALKLARLARKIHSQLKHADEKTMTDLLTGRINPEGPSRKIDRAVP